MKTCCTCKERKARSEFHRNRKTKDGLHRRCKGCRKATEKTTPHSQESYARHRVYLNEQKQGPCEDCGNSFHPAVMHFHHFGDKTIEVAKLVMSSIEVIEAEIAKCVLLCSNCHIMRHVNERECALGL